MDRDRYLHETFGCDDPVLTRILERMKERDMPPISVLPSLGRLLTLLVKAAGAKRVLEIGALGGYSGVCLARGLGRNGTLTSLELSPTFAEFARSNLAEAGFAEQVRYRVGPAISSLASLVLEGARFDFVFIDADKPNYANYLEYALQMALPGALICADNVLLGDRILDSANQDASVVGMRTFVKRLTSDRRLESVGLPIGDGFAIARVAR